MKGGKENKLTHKYYERLINIYDDSMKSSTKKTIITARREQGFNGSSQNCHVGTLDELGQQECQTMTSGSGLVERESGVSDWEVSETNFEC